MGRPLRIGLSSPYFGSTYGGGEKYLGRTAELVRDWRPADQVEIVCPAPVDTARYEKTLGLDLRGIGFAAAAGRVTPMHRLANRMTPLRPLRDRVLAARAERASAAYDVHLAQAYRIRMRTAAPRAGLLVQFPYPSGPGLERFQVVVAQSEYVRGWVRRYWAREAVVVNPPIDPAGPVDLTAKGPSLLSVGRFFAGGHGKRHDAMVEAFKGLVDGGLRGWTLHLAGAVHREGPHARYYDDVRRRAAGYPVQFHPDVPRSELLRLYAQASIYWHAAGYGLQADADPERFEHFGMTVAEAMKHGCVPMVFDGGGLPEVVRPGEGFRWRSLAELVKVTRNVAGDTALRLGLGRAAQDGASARYAPDRFRRDMRAALEPLFA